MDKSKSANITSTLDITFKPDDRKHCFETNGKDVVVTGNSGKHDHGSSKVKLKNLVDYKWEQKHYPGRLIAVHLDGNHVAYAIKVNNRGTIEGMVRVVNIKYSQRALIKGLFNEVLDLQFSYNTNELYLACIEETALHIYQIYSTPEKIQTTFILKITDPNTDLSPNLITHDKINWCPSVPDEKDELDEYATSMLVWVRGNTFKCYNINTVVETYGTGQYLVDFVKEGCVKYSENSAAITDAILSSDGTTLAISSEDGVMRFYQVYLHAGENPRCLHQWKPHGGKPITCFFFLDNLTESSSDKSLWKNAITGADNNTELKIWSCETWKCTQTINFKSPIDADLIFKAKIDRTASYLVLSDMINRELYILQIVKDIAIATTNELKNGEDTKLNITTTTPGSLDLTTTATTTPHNNSLAYIKSVAGFPLSSSILSFAIVDAAVRRYKCGSSDSYLIEELSDFDEENNSLYCAAIHMYLVQPKSVQECRVLYQPLFNEVTNVDVRSTISHDNSGMENVADSSLSSFILNRSLEPIKKVEPTVKDIEVVLPKVITSTSLERLNKLVSPNSKTPTSIITPKNVSQINLMTPDSFNHSSGKKSPETVSSEVLSTLIMLANATSSTTSPDLKKKSHEGINLLSFNFGNNKAIEEQEQLKIRSSVELQKSLIEHSIPPKSSTEMVASGGSSPSREVQEILSLKDSDQLNELFDDSDLMLDENDGIVSSDEFLLETEIKSNNELDYKFNEIKDEVKNEIVNLNESDWPKVPDVPIMVNQAITNKQMDEMYMKMDQMIEIMQTQSCQISELRNQLCDIEKIRTEETVKSNSYSTKLEANLSKLIEEYLIRYERTHNTKLDTFLSQHDKQNRELRDSIIQSITPVLLNQLTERMSHIFVAELQRHTLPLVASKLDIIKKQIHIDVSEKLKSSDQVLKETLIQVCTSKTMIETFGNSILNGVKNGLQTSYLDILGNTLIPAYEKSTSEMFQQIHLTFMDGIKKFSKQFEFYMTQYQPHNDNSEEVLGMVQRLPENIQLINDKTISTCAAQMSTDLNKDFKVLQGNLLKTIKDNIRNEIQKGFAAQVTSLEDSVLSAVRSQAQTPAPSIQSVQEQIKGHLAQGQINNAFHLALLSNDLNLVEYAMEKADYGVVFNPCPLEQSVLLSMIQQISADMTNHTENKQKYLSDAILSLNFRDTITSEHAPDVMGDLYQNCQKFLKTHPNSSMCSGVKMLIMAVQGMGFKPQF